MHIFVTNDDGPPSAESSPYVLAFVAHLEAAGHLVSVVLPDEQRSWIAKAHMIGQDVKAKPYTPPSYTFPGRTEGSSDDSHQDPSGDSRAQRRPWQLVNSTPATCAQIGLHHLYKPTASLPAVDVVVSGPNYGRNTTAVFALSSGTLGAALEAAVTGFRAIALSFAFTDRTNEPVAVAAACAHAVRVVEHIATKGDWAAPCTVMRAGASDIAEGRGNPGGIVFSVNVPVRADVGTRPTRWTQMLQNAWASSCFAEHAVEHDGVLGDDGPARTEVEIRSQEAASGRDGAAAEQSAAEERGTASPGGERHFKWTPKFTDVYESVRRAGEGSDGWAVSEGQTSVTMLRANFMHIDGVKGELKL